jgi:SAM-dependent methyltransferase
MSLQTTNPESWEREYGKGGIPSSVRSQPSNVVKEFVEAFEPFDKNARLAVDIGCGSGRNSIYLAEKQFYVTAMDYATLQVQKLDEAAKELGLSEQIRALSHDVSKPWPLPSHSINLAIDTFCFKHQIHAEAVQMYVSELARVTRPGARFLLFLAAKEDGYYAQFPTSDQTRPGCIILDPGNEILSRLYDKAEIIDLFKDFSLSRHVVKISENMMHDKPYKRSSHVFWFLRT